MSNKKPMIVGILLVVAVLGAGTGVWYWRHRQDVAAAAQPKPMMVQAVDVIVPETISWFPTARLVGTVVAKRSVTVANEVAGVVKDVAFESGDEVQPGQVLLTMDTTTELADLASTKAAEKVAQSAVEVAKADIAVSKSNLELAQSNQRRFETAGNSVSASELDKVNADLRKATSDLERQTSALAQAQAEVEQAQARSQQIQTIIDKKTIKAPFRALASMRTVHPGQYLAEGASIVMLAEITDDIYLDFAVPQEYAVRVKPGTVVTASSRVLEQDAVKITVISMDATVNPTTRNVRVRSSVADPQHKLKQGMFIDVEVPVEAPKQYVTLPNTAIRRGAFGDHVFALVPDEGSPLLVAKMKMVTVGPDLGGKIIVTSGVAAGDKIAAAGSFKLWPDAKVMEAEKKPAAPPDSDKPAEKAQSKADGLAATNK